MYSLLLNIDEISSVVNSHDIVVKMKIWYYMIVRPFFKNKKGCFAVTNLMKVY